RRRRPSREGKGHARGTAAGVRERVPGRDGYAGLEVAALLVPRGRQRRGDRTGRRADVRRANEGEDGRDRLEPCRDGLAPGCGVEADRGRGQGRVRTQPSPASRARTMASARLATCSLLKMLVTWLPTVLGDTSRRAAMLALPRPAAMRSSTSRSR